MAKLPDPLGTLTPDARVIYDKITSKRGPMRGGPYASLMHDPALAEKVATSGNTCDSTARCPALSASWPSWSRPAR